MFHKKILFFPHTVHCCSASIHPLSECSSLLLLVSLHRPEHAPPTVFLTHDITISQRFWRALRGTVSKYKLYFFLHSAIWNFDIIYLQFGTFKWLTCWCNRFSSTCVLISHGQEMGWHPLCIHTHQPSLACFSPHLHYHIKLMTVCPRRRVWLIFGGNASNKRCMLDFTCLHTHTHAGKQQEACQIRAENWVSAPWTNNSDTVCAENIFQILYPKWN